MALQWLHDASRRRSGQLVEGPVTRSVACQASRENDERAAALRDMMTLSHRLARRYGRDYTSNYAYREDAIVNLLNHNGYPDLVHTGGRVGSDATSPQWSHVAIKSCQTNVKRLHYRTGFAEFSRQQNPRSRADARLHRYQAIVYGVFRPQLYDPVLVVLVRGAAAIRKHAEIIERHQARFDAQPSSAVQKRDTIRVALYEVYDALEPGADFELFYDKQRVDDEAAFLDMLSSPGGVPIPQTSSCA